MAVVVYRCDTCKRTKTIPRNERGFEHVGRCNITLGCRGKLVLQRTIEGYSRGSVIDPVEGLTDWYPRKVLHDHTQTITSNEWTITHGFGTEPSVVVYVNDDESITGLTEVTPSKILNPDPDTTILEFSEQYSGKAQLIARQSNPLLFDPTVEEAEAEVENARITTGTELTIGTRISLGENVNIRIKLTFVSSNNSEYSVEYDVDDNPSVDSAWNDYNKISLKGKIYLVRSFNFIDREMVKGGEIESGANVYFSAIDNGTGVFRGINKNEVVVLLADEPYKSVDKDTNHYIDTYETFENKKALYYDSGVIYSLPSLIRTIYPPIRKI